MKFVLRQPAVQGVQLVRTSDELLCGKYIWSKSTAKENVKIAETGEERRAASPKNLTSVSKSKRPAAAIPSKFRKDLSILEAQKKPAAGRH